MNISKNDIIGRVVAMDYRTAGVFEQRGIDFCCNGNRSIEAACEEQKISTEELIDSLQRMVDKPSKKEGVGNFEEWPLDLLADYIEKKHHRYVREQIPVIQAFLGKIVLVHGGIHPELSKIKMHFDACAIDLTTHMQKEELILFPFIRKMVLAKMDGNTGPAAPFGTVQNPIQMMMHEHDTEGQRFRKIGMLSNQYAVPSDGCNTYRAAYAALHAFEDDLHLHIHLENNILFPKAIEMEQYFG